MAWFKGCTLKGCCRSIPAFRILLTAFCNNVLGVNFDLFQAVALLKNDSIFWHSLCALRTGLPPVLFLDWEDPQILIYLPKKNENATLQQKLLFFHKNVCQINVLLQH